MISLLHPFMPGMIREKLYLKHRKEISITGRVLGELNGESVDKSENFPTPAS
jgi:hypothetical protein